MFEDSPEGVPQGGPLSPLLENIMLNECDHELERRGYCFVRYADDMLIFCKSKKAATRTLILPYIEKKLFLRVNREKTRGSRRGQDQIPEVQLLHLHTLFQFHLPQYSTRQKCSRLMGFL